MVICSCFPEIELPSSLRSPCETNNQTNKKTNKTTQFNGNQFYKCINISPFIAARSTNINCEDRECFDNQFCNSNSGTCECNTGFVFYGTKCVGK